MTTQTDFRQGLFWNHITFQNIMYMFQVGKLSKDFCREIEGQISQNIKQAVNGTIQQQLYISQSDRSVMFFQNCATWLKSTVVTNWISDVSMQNAIQYFLVHSMLKEREQTAQVYRITDACQLIME